jgi:type IV pilus assembly protein PilB
MSDFDVDKLLEELGEGATGAAGAPAGQPGPASASSEPRPILPAQDEGGAHDAGELTGQPPAIAATEDAAADEEAAADSLGDDAGAATVAPAVGSSGSVDRSSVDEMPRGKGGRRLGLRARMRSGSASTDASQDISRDVSVDLDPALGAWLRRGIKPLDSVACMSGWCTPEAEALLEAAEASGVLDGRQIKAVQGLLKQTPGLRVGELVLDQGADEASWCKLLSEELGMEVRRFSKPMRNIGDDNAEDEGEADPLADAEIAEIDIARAERMGLGYCKDRGVVPLGVDRGRLLLGVCDPTDAFVVEDARLRLSARSIRPIIIMRSELASTLEGMGADEADTNVDEILSDIDEDDVTVEKDNNEAVDLEREAAESPVIRYVNYIIQQAVKEGASDIHIEPTEKSLKVRFRIDGILFEAMQPPGKMTAAITSRLKIMANLDISERRIPQDGRIRCNVQGRKLDLRVSTLPTATGGEKTVMRILDTKSINVTLDDLGFDPDTLTIWKKQVDQPHGIVLVTGPTGSGKTTTLYASLGQMDKKTKNISTVEDPVEYHLDGITQTQVHEKVGMTFAAALRSLLRQDPDVVLLGEIRDIETATIAIQASLTGHLVLSTLHTNDAPSAVTRLGNIGVENFLIGAAMNAVLAQRLVRRICGHCKKQAELSEEMIEYLTMQGIDTSAVYEGGGCDKCRGTGYSGRLGIYELLVVDDHLRDTIARGPNVTEFRRMCCERGMVTLRQDGFKKVSEGRTTPKEILRVTDSTI